MLGGEEMSSDVMIVCKEIGSHFEGDNYDDAIFVDEASMGCAWSEFGDWLTYYLYLKKGCCESLSGYEIEEIIRAVKTKSTHENLIEKEFIRKLNKLRGKKIFIECW